MISLNRRTKVFLCKEPTDMRASYDTLFAKVKGVLAQDPFSGHVFVFMSARRTSVKCLFYDGTGLAILMKRMERGALFSRINPLYRGEITMTSAEFALFFEGADMEKRFLIPPGMAPMPESPRVVKKNFNPLDTELQTPPT